MTTIAVFGSLNADLIVEVPALPIAGETIIGANLRRSSGGKGGNQAFAAARLAGPTTTVRMVASIGADDAGDMMRRDLSASGVDISGVRTSDLPSGTALITVSADGDNTIVVAPGANADWTDPASAVATLSPGDIVLLQLEIPLDAVREIAKAASARGALVVLNAAPASTDIVDVLDDVDVLVVNEIEAAQLLDLRQLTASTVGAAGKNLHADLVVTRGSDGSIVADRAGALHEISALAVNAIDTVGAGDAFVGALVAALADGIGLAEAARIGSVAGGLTATVAQPRYEDLNRETIDHFLKELA